MNTEFTTRCDFSDLLEEKKVVSSSPGPTGEAVLLAVPPKFEKEPFGRIEEKGFASFPLSKARRHYPAVFLRFDGKLIQRTDLAEVESAFPFVQPLPEGEILVVGARCHYRKGNPEKNAAVYGPDGALRRQFILGDGISGVQTTKEGMIWVSYCDEGIFGNFGWDKPMGAAGLVCFDSTGKVVWEFQPPEGTDSIADCYAFNVTADSVWTCYYTNFPIVRISSQMQTRAWKNGIDGASAMAVHPERVVLWGGYAKNGQRCVVQEIIGEELRNTREAPLVLPPPVQGGFATVIGRGPLLHAFTANHWLTFDISDLSLGTKESSKHP